MPNRQDDVLNQQLSSISALDSSVEETLPEIIPETLAAVDPSYFASPIFASSIMLFVISILVFSIMGYLIINNKNPIDILKTFGIPLIIVAAILIVITGLDMNKLTPVIGLLGTIAGYLLGKSEGGNCVDETSQTETNTPKEQSNGQG